MSQMLPESAEVMRRAACGEVCPAPAPRPPADRLSENKELLRQQLLSANRDHGNDNSEPKVKLARNRQKNRWKLKFHHQALPQEYLDHYEQTLQKATKKTTQEKPKDQNVDVGITSEAFKLWAQRLAGVQCDTGALTVPRSTVANTAAKQKDEKKKKPPTITPSKVMTYEDLPYMGEMTLNNSKPRRGRKPKKADICHLIYENYGTVVPGQPPPQDKLNHTKMCSSFRNVDSPVNTSKTDLQNKIITSLLERKLSQENKRRLENLSPSKLCSPDDPMPEAPLTSVGPLHSDDEPLNLCIRDLHDLKIEIQKKFGNIYTSIPEIKAEVADEQDSVKSEQPNAISVIQRNTNVPRTASSSPDLSHQTRNISPTLSEPAQSTTSPDDDKFSGYVYWPNAGIYMHPLALQTQLLYYQKLAANGQSPLGKDKLTSPAGASSPIEKALNENKNKLVLKQLSELLDPKIIKQTDESKRPEPAKKRASPNPTQGTVKRKRSAIFIPPMPARTSSSTPTTEVSICKFKFTGGSKPSLQEKKMLSVDSGGNFRFSGTGSKGSKSYDYIQKNIEERMTSIKPQVPAPVAEPQNKVVLKDELSKKKRKSRKTLQREKLEQTFKEKGFLIQTQQLQSAEGATYCKFRQLRKFTRYLFRSWKDYLPGELDERTEQDNVKTAQPSESAATTETAAEWG